MSDYNSIHTGQTIDNRVTQVATNTSDIAALRSRVDGAEAKIPSSATSSNKLADKAYVDSTASGLNSTISGLGTRIGSVESDMGNKVDKVSGKGLSTNDFTNAYKTKLDGLPTGLEISNSLDGKASASSVSDVSSRVTAVEGKIPSAATSSNQLADKEFVNNGLSGKVSTETGKGLSANDYTTEDKTKLGSLPSGDQLNASLNGKQPTLVSGTNIKTVNGESLLGSGNIIAGDPNAVKYVAQTLTSEQQAQARRNIGAVAPNELSGQYYGFHPTQATLPTGMANSGYAFVGETEPFAVWNYDGSEWSDSEVRVQAIEGKPGVGFSSVSTNQDGTLLIYLTSGDTITVDLNHNHPQYAKYMYCQSQAEYDAISPKDSGTIYLILETE